MKIIDAHNHPDWLGHDLQAVLSNMDQYGIEKTWLLNWECPEIEASQVYRSAASAAVLGSCTGPIPFSRCLSFVERAPNRFILGYCPDPRLPDASAKLIAAHDIYGARVCGEFKYRMMYDNPDALRLFRTAAELGMPVVFHLQFDFQATRHDPWGEWFGGSIDAVERTLQACPKTTFLGHAQGFWISISNDELYKQKEYPSENSPVKAGGRLIQLLDQYPNLHCDLSAGSGLSALRRDPAFAKDFLDKYQDRIVYARDCFHNAHQEFINSLGLPEKILRKLYHENAKNLLIANDL